MMTFRSPLLLAYLLLFIIFSFQYIPLSSAATSIFGGKKWAYDEVPNPMTNPAACGRPAVPHSAICDPEQKIPKDKQDEIEGYINALTNAEFAVVIIDQINLKGLSARNIDIAAEQFAVKLHNTWGVGDKVTNNGILIFLSVSDRVVYISTGSGVMKELNYDMIQSLIQNMKPHLRRSDYGSAIANCIIEIDIILNGQGNSKIMAAYGDKVQHKPKISPPSTSSSDESWGESLIGILFFVLFVAIGTLMQCRNNWRLRGYERGTAVLNRLMKEVEKPEDNKFNLTSCPICLEDFPAAEIPALRRTLESQNSEAQDGVSDENTHNASAQSPSSTSVPENKKVMALKCGHAFCKGCLEDYLNTANATKCPICRQPLEGDGHNHSPSTTPITRRNNVRRSFFNFGTSSNSPASYDYQPGPTQDYGSTNSNMRENTNGSTGTSTYTETRQEGTYYTPPDPSSQPFFARRAPEYRFRLHRMRYLYPDVMTAELLRSMNSAIDRGSVQDFRSEAFQRSVEVQRIVTEIREAAKNSARNSGSRGSSRSSFGGGSSRGGGGGRW